MTSLLTMDKAFKPFEGNTDKTNELDGEVCLGRTAELFKVNRQTAELEFDRFAEEWDIEQNPQFLSEDDVESLNQQKLKIVSEIMRGRVVITEECKLVYTLKKPKGELKKVTFHCEDSSVFIDMGKQSSKRENPLAAGFNACANLIRLPVSVINNMSVVDSKFCVLTVTPFFLTP